VVATLGSLVPFAAQTASAAPGDIIQVFDSIDVTAIPHFKWLINEDTSTGDPSFTADNVAACEPLRAQPSPAAAVGSGLEIYNTSGTKPLSECPWPSVHSSPGHTGVVTSGTDADLNSLKDKIADGTLADGKYLVSVTEPGWKIDGAHFTIQNHALVSVNGEPVSAPVIRITMNPMPKVTATVRVHVFNDNASTNGQWDGQTETLIENPDHTLVNDMSGFVAHINDVLAEVTTDVYGNPLCTEYVLDGNGQVVLDPDGAPRPLTFIDHGASGSQLAGTDSSCISDHHGDITIPYLGQNRYAVTVVPPNPRDHDPSETSKWIQTTTLEGGHDWDTWSQEGATGYDTELIVGGERVTPVTFGFIKLSADPANAHMPNYADGSPASAELGGALHVGTAYIGSQAGPNTQPLAGTNLANAVDSGPIHDGLISINCLAGCTSDEDSVVWTGRANADGTWSVKGLQNGSYSVAFWDETQNYILALEQVDITPKNTDEPYTDLNRNHQYDQGEPFVDNNGDGVWTKGTPKSMGTKLLPGWFTNISGSIFVDDNEDGIRQPGEHGVPDFFLSVRTRGNSLVDQGASTSVTKDDGAFDFSQAYPLGQFLILEAYNPRFKNTGFTYKTDNDPIFHTVTTSQVDVNFLPIIGLHANIDWGVKPYSPQENGGIAGTVTYDVTRNELDPRESLAEDYQPSVAGIAMQLWKSKKDPSSPTGYQQNADGSYVQYGITTSGAECARSTNDAGLAWDDPNASGTCFPQNIYLSETWTRPVGCVALDANGDRLNQLALPDAPADPDYAHLPDAILPASDPKNQDCIEAPMNGLQIGGDGSVDGNYAFPNAVDPTKAAKAIESGYDQSTDAAAANFTPALAPDDYLVEAVNPPDTVLGSFDTSTHRYTRYKYKFTDETSINIFSGATYVPQGGYRQELGNASAGFNLSTNNERIRIDRNSLATGPYASCAGSLHTVPKNDTTDAPITGGLSETNPDMANGGGSPFSGQRRPSCDAKLVKVVDGRSSNPTFYMYTDVPIPTKFYGLVNDDLNVQTNRRSIMLGEVAALANGPVGVYDENGNWKYTAHSDVNGFYEILLPSMDTYNCPLPAGPCANVYRLVGNDPGTLAHPNVDYNPQFRTIATEFQGWTGVVHPVDQAVTHIGITIEGPASQFGALALCKLADTNPTIYRIDRPFYDPAIDAAVTTGPTSGQHPAHPFTITGSGFGSAGQLTIGTTTVTASSWAPTSISFVAPAAVTSAPGAYQIAIKANGLSTVNGLTFHVLENASASANNARYLKRSDVYEVGSEKAENAGARWFNPVHDAWDPQTNSPAGFAGLDQAGRSVTGGRAIQRAIEAAHGTGNNAGTSRKMVVVYPNEASNYAAHNAFAAYFENLILHGRVKIQGVGPGGPGTHGTVIDGSQFWSATQATALGQNAQVSDGNYSDDWRVFGDSLRAADFTGFPEGQGVLAVADPSIRQGAIQTDNNGNTVVLQTQWGANNGTNDGFNGVDGATLTGGDQQGFPTTVNGSGGQPTGQAPDPGPAQGGAITLDQYVRNFNITNNQIQSNGGTYGALRIGTPDLPAPYTNNHNERVNVSNNRVLANGGTNLAGALGLFAGSDNYTVTKNDFCGNFSAEYGGAISHYGASPNGSIDHNRIYYNQSYDEGGAIMIAGQLPANNRTLSPGAGAVVGGARQGVTVDANEIVSNLANDDGGAIRLLMAGNYPFLIRNNIIANNVSTHEGAGIALDDAPDVSIINNTVVKNITTATAATSDGLAAPAGLATGLNSSNLQTNRGVPNGDPRRLPANAPNFSKPKLLNNLFADNRAGKPGTSGSGATAFTGIVGIGAPGDSSAIQRWDVGSIDGGLRNANNGNNGPANAGTIDAYSTVVNSNPTGPSVPRAGALSWHQGNEGSGGIPVANQLAPNSDGAAPSSDGHTTINFVRPVDYLVDSLQWRTNPNTQLAQLVAINLPITSLSDYHLTPRTNNVADIAYNSALASSNGITAPAQDIDGDIRPQFGAFDRGADEIRPATANLSITKTDGVTIAPIGGTVTYTITVTNNGPDGVAGAVVTDTLPAVLGNATWTCAGAAGACGVTSGSGGISDIVTLAANTSVVYSLTATVSPSASSGSSLANTATVTAPASVNDPDLRNNTATDTDTIRPVSDLSITKSDGQSSVATGSSVTYTIVVSNAGPSPVTGAAVADTFPTAVSAPTVWTCLATAGSSCTTGGTGRNRTGTVTLLSGGKATYTATATLASVIGSVSNTASVTAPNGTTDPDLTNNSATDTDQVAPPALPVLGVLDSFNRANANNLGGNWSQTTIRVNANQAACPPLTLCLFGGQAIWNDSNVTAKQGAAASIVGAPVNGTALVLKASGTNALPTSFIRVRYSGGQVLVESTTNAGLTYTAAGSLAGTLAAGDRLSAIADPASSTVYVFRTTGAVDTLLGSVTVAAMPTGTRIGIQLPVNARVDDFRGGSVA
jgi:uncharacterized repeat protein (TIGR01451 family)